MKSQTALEVAGLSLRGTQLEFLKNPKYQHPYYWASFIPSGNWQPMK